MALMLLGFGRWWWWWWFAACCCGGAFSTSCRLVTFRMLVDGVEWVELNRDGSDVFTNDGLEGVSMRAWWRTVQIDSSTRGR